MSKRNTKTAAKTADLMEGERRAWSGQQDGTSIDNAWDGTNESSTVRSEDQISSTILRPVSENQQTSELTLLLKFMMDKDEKDRAERDRREQERLALEDRKEHERRQAEDKKEMECARLEQARLDLEHKKTEQRDAQHQAELKEKRKATACQQLKTWENSTNPEAYLVNFEAILMESRIPEEEWMGVFRKQLSGKAVTAYQELAMEPGAPYREVKSALLEAMGATIEQARRTIWLAKINVDDGPELVLKKVVRAVNRIKTDLTSPEYAAKEIFKGFLIHHFFEKTLMMLEAHKEETTHQQIQTLQHLWKSKDLYTKRRMLPNDPSSTQKTGWRRRDSGPPKGSWHAGGQDQTTQHRKEGQRGTRWGGKREYYGKPEKSSIVCYKCQKVGHYKSECPEAKVKMSRIKSPGPEGVEGKINAEINGQ